MSATELIAAVLLGLCVCANLLTSVGIVKAANLYDQIHFLGAGSIVGAVSLAAAVVLHEGWSQGAEKSVLIGVLLLVSNPVLSHATARAGKIRRENRLTADERSRK
jgi:multicomponent Na+:H+ antiporter subunit G